jgi:hypothetical protein
MGRFGDVGSVGRLAAVLACVTAALLAACGDGGDGVDAGPDPASPQSTVATVPSTTVAAGSASSAPSSPPAGSSNATPTSALEDEPAAALDDEPAIDIDAAVLAVDELPAGLALTTTWNEVGGAESSADRFVALGCGPVVPTPGQPVVAFENVQYGRDFDVATDQGVQELVAVLQRVWKLTDARSALQVVRDEVEACPEVTLPDSDRVLRREVIELEAEDGIDALLISTSASGGGFDDARSYEMWARRGDVVTSIETFTAAPLAAEDTMALLQETVLAKLAAAAE